VSDSPVYSEHAPLDPSVSAIEGSFQASGSAAPASWGEDAVIDLRSDVAVDRPRSEALDRRGLLVARKWQRFTKRMIDVLGSAVLIVLVSPILILTAIAIRATSRGPVLFVQERIGEGGRPFPMLKFRSMRVQAHDERENIIHLNEVSGPVFKIRNDPRLTKVGRLMRKLSIDELPQLANVFVGSMSLVGPRPPLREEFEGYDSRERRRMSVRPGLTCIWQVSGRSEVDFDTWVDLDLEYIDTWTLGLDLKLLLLTVPAVLSGRGAY
jgi:lipopolysaccharide/colanic/teichoic acid biosynthesis glycosyltransferase